MKKRGLLIFLIIILVLPSIQALTFKQFEPLNLKIPCFNNGTFCTGTATCNLTVLYPNYTDVVDKVLPDNWGNYHNYTLNTSQTSTLGEYSAIVSCTDGVYNGHSTFTFDITPTGHEITSSQGLVSIAIMFGILFLAFMFCYYGYQFSTTKNLHWLTLLFIPLSFILGVYSLHFGYIITLDILYPLKGEGVQFAMYISILWILVAVSLILMIKFMIDTIKRSFESAKIKKHGEDYNPQTKTYE